MAENFKDSPYWTIFADVVSFMRENYPVTNEPEYPDKVVQSYERAMEKYRGSEYELFFSAMCCASMHELNKRFYGT